ncbi:hypothetical protein B4O97_01190 [Marispirochaeta aestuarii]|uniref:Uncharacterized protein n=1 Tax=Marispirochaeta aestuarii TaxID=1963862 RepID=A0A1Y1S353_9SPIO|nr:hypothetical protein [Marispirochaeta aestuarii]ORC38401.1 hypothetical protein B4O97_01190 [Marispirochaeta aestuarii]
MIRILSTPFAVLLALSLLFSCATSGSAPGTSTSAVQAPAEVPLRLADARPDLAAVVTAVYGSLRNPEAPLDGTVLFDKPLLIEGETDIRGFGLGNVAIEEDTPLGDDPLFRKTSGLLRLADPLGREMYWSWAAEYLLQDEGILILSSAAAPVYGNFDRIRFFFVEKDQLPALSYLEDANFEELLPLVAANASEAGELKAENGMKDMYLFVFDMTRSESSVDLELYSDGTLADAVVSDSRSINQEGWRFIMAEGSFRFGNDAKYRLYAAESRDAPRVLSVLAVED